MKNNSQKDMKKNLKISIEKDNTTNKYQNKASLPLDYQTYVFDLYGTLLDIHTDEGDTFVWEKLSLYYGYQGAVYLAEELQDSYLKLVKAGTTTASDSHEAYPEIDITKVFQKLYQNKGIEPDEHVLRATSQFFRILTTQYLRLYPGTIEMLQDLRKQGKRIILLSNAQRVFTEQEMRLLGIWDLFDTIYISSDYGTKKPDQEFFRLLVEDAEIDLTKSLFVGNDSRTDIKGAMTLGMDTFYVNSNISPQNDRAADATYQIEDFGIWAI